MANKEKYILVFGMSIYDIFGFVGCRYRSHDSNPGRIKNSYGGVCRNIAENMGRIGVNTKLITFIGDDETGKGMMNYAKEVGIDMEDTLVVENGVTPTYMAIVDENGSIVSGVVDAHILEHVTTEFVDSKAEAICNAEYVICDADNVEVVEHMVKKYSGKTKFILDPGSAARAEKVEHLLPYFHTIKPNRLEAEVLCGFEISTIEDVREAGRYFLDQGVKDVFISLDAEGVYYTNGAGEALMKAEGVEVVNDTGGGDAFVAGIGYGYANGLSICETVQYGMTMSILTIACEESIDADLSREKVEQKIEKVQWKKTIYKN